jgi:serine/threonine-protein kinase RsbW
MNSPGSKHEFSWKFPATLLNVGRVCSAVNRILIKYPMHKKDRFATELLLREALNNAVLHGCKSDPLLSFFCGLTITDQEVNIEISDEGAGFDWRCKPNTVPGNSNESGRGLSIYAIYATSIKFNETGNCVCLTRIFNEQHSNQGEKDD